jgi:hypothetical protein
MLTVDSGVRQGRKVNLYSYIVTHDSGFAPNPFWGYCTLATCKPVIRRTADIGDWIVGLSRKKDGNRLIYAMRVDEILTYANYFTDSLFACMIPDRGTGKVSRLGDNIYQPMPNGGFTQLRSMHSRYHDLVGKRVLISETFYYFGSQPVELQGLDELKVSRNHKKISSQDAIRKFLDFIAKQPPGVNAAPTIWR